MRSPSDDTPRRPSLRAFVTLLQWLADHTEQHDDIASEPPSEPSASAVKNDNDEE